MNGDITSAFDRAQKSALREAVEQGVGLLVSSRTHVRNYEMITDDMLTKSQGYVREYTIVDRGTLDDNTYEVVVEASVNLGNLAKDLDALELIFEQAGIPRIECRGREYSADEAGERIETDIGVLQPEVTRLLQSLGGTVFEVSSTTQDGHPPDIIVEATATVSTNSVAVIPFSSQRLADTGLVTATADVEISATWTGSSESIAKVGASARGFDATQRSASRKAVVNSVNEVREAFSKALTSSLRDRAYGDRLIQLTVIASPEKQLSFERNVASDSNSFGIDRLVTRASKDGVTRYDARVAFSSFRLARNLSSTGVQGADVEVLAVSSNRIELQLR